MNKFLKELFVFFLIIIILVFGINLFQTKYNNAEKHYQKQYNEIFNHKLNANAIIIGTSHAVHSIRPNILNSNLPNTNNSSIDTFKFYNFSYNGSNPKFYNNWYNEIFKPNYLKPELIIIGVDWFMFDNNWLWRNIEQDSEYFPNDLFWDFWWNNNTKTRDFKKSDLIINRYPILKYRQKIKYSLLLWKGNPDFPIEKYDNGFIPFEKPMTEGSSKPTVSKVNINQTQVKYFKDLINQFKQENIKLIFVMSPEYNINTEYYKNLESIKLIEQIAKSNNIPFLNYNVDLRSDINIDKTLFSDWGHMNEKGSKIFSKKLKNDLELLFR